MKTKSSKSPIYEGPFEYLGGVLQRIGTEEGQLIRDASGNYTAQYYLKDHLGSVRQVISETGTVLQETEYYPFGLAVNRTSGNNNYRFLGREDQPQTNWVDLMKRMYDPPTVRFTSVDPSPDIAGQESLTPYQYGWNNPVLRSDPNVDCPNCVTGAIGAGIGALIGGGIEAGMQLYQHGEINDWKAVGGAALQGGITGGAAGFTGGASLLVTTSVSAGANVVGGAINNAVQGKDITVKSVAIDAAVGVAAGVGGKVLDKVLSKAEGIVYLRTNPKTGAEYVGQAKSATHFDARQTTHDTKLGVKHDYQVIDRAKPGTKLDVAEESGIRARGGANNKSNPNGTLENKRYQMNEERYRAAGGKVDRPN